MNKAMTTTQQRTVPEPFSPVQASILQRKCACGNHTVASGECADCAKKKMGLQRKLTIGASNDPLEQEADRIADQVMTSPSNGLVSGTPIKIQRFAGSPSEQEMEVPPSVERVLASPGRPMEAALREDMEGRFGYDFSQVRVHTGDAAEQSAREVNANAYAVRNDVVFGAGQFVPGTNKGRQLIAHELTHVLQQRKFGTTHLARESYIEDASNCTLTANYIISLSFVASGRYGWTTEREDYFIENAHRVIENVFNANLYRIYPSVMSVPRFGGLWNSDCTCHHSGFTPRVHINVRRGGISTRSGDWNTMVTANPEGVFRRSHASTEPDGMGRLDENDVRERNGQPLAHEFGHSIGLHHPGRGIGRIQPNSHEEYAYTGSDIESNEVAGTDLMGRGSNLRPFYFNRWMNYLNNNHSECGYELSLLSLRRQPNSRAGASFDAGITPSDAGVPLPGGV